MDNPIPTSRITTTFSLCGQEFDAEGFSVVAGREPTKIWRAWASSVKGNPRFHQIVWSYRISKKLHWSLTDAINEMLDVFDARRDAILAFAGQHKCVLQLRCRLYGDETVIVYEIAAETIQRMSGLQCSFSVSIDSTAHKAALQEFSLANSESQESGDVPSDL